MEFQKASLRSEPRRKPSKKTTMNLYDRIAKLADRENPTRREYLLYRLFERTISKPAPIYTREVIRAYHPYIRFIFIDTDSRPIATNIPVGQVYSSVLFHPVRLSRIEPHVLHEGLLHPDARRGKPVLRSFTLDAPTGIIDRTIPSAEHPVSVAAEIDPNARREKPVLRSFTPDAPTGIIDQSITSAEQPVSVAAVIEPDAQRGKPVLRSFTPGAPSGVIDRTIPSAEQPVSVAAAIDPDVQRDKPVLRSFTPGSPNGIIDRTVPSAEQPCDSFNVSLSIFVPRCYDHNFFRYETRCKIVRFHRYGRINPVACLKMNPAT